MAEAPGIEEVVDRHDSLTVARAIYRTRVEQYPGSCRTIERASWPDPFKIRAQEDAVTDRQAEADAQAAQAHTDTAGADAGVMMLPWKAQSDRGAKPERASPSGR